MNRKLNKKKPVSKAQQVYVCLAVFIKRPQADQIGVLKLLYNNQY